MKYLRYTALACLVANGWHAHAMEDPEGNLTLSINSITAVLLGLHKARSIDDDGYMYLMHVLREQARKEHGLLQQQEREKNERHDEQKEIHRNLAANTKVVSKKEIHRNLAICATKMVPNETVQ